jgi:hypothetical protein
VNENNVKLFETSSNFRFLAAFFRDKTSMDLVHCIRAVGKFCTLELLLLLLRVIELEN